MCLPALAPLGAAAMGASSVAASGTALAIGQAALGTALVGSTIASPILSIRGQQQAAKAQATAQRRQTQAEYKRLGQAQTAERINQRFEAEERAKEQMQAVIQAQKARATARTVAGESNVAGVSIDNLLADFSRQEAIFRFGLQRQKEQMGIVRELRMNDSNLGSYNTALSINQPIARPNYAGALTSTLSMGMQLSSLQATGSKLPVD